MEHALHFSLQFFRDVMRDVQKKTRRAARASCGHALLVRGRLFVVFLGHAFLSMGGRLNSNVNGMFCVLCQVKCLGTRSFRARICITSFSMCAV